MAPKRSKNDKKSDRKRMRKAIANMNGKKTGFLSILGPFWEPKSLPKGQKMRSKFEAEKNMRKRGPKGPQKQKKLSRFRRILANGSLAEAWGG